MALTLRSNNNIVIPAANTGKDNTNKKTVTKKAHKNTSIRYASLPKTRTVVIKLIPPIIEEAPARCRAKITQSTQAPGCPVTLETGGYTVHLQPAPLSTIELISTITSAGAINQ